MTVQNQPLGQTPIELLFDEVDLLVQNPHIRAIAEAMLDIDLRDLDQEAFAQECVDEFVARGGVVGDRAIAVKFAVEAAHHEMLHADDGN